MRLAQRVPKTAAAILLLTWTSATMFGQAPPDYSQQQPQAYPPAQGDPQQQGYPPAQNYPAQQGYPQQPQAYPPQQGYPQQPYPQAQGYPPQQGYPQAPPPYFPPQQLNSLVSRIALYPDPLLAQVLAASTFYDQIPAAAQYSNEHRYMPPPQLAAAIQADQVPWDPSVQALLPFPSILTMMASDPNWTQQLGTAFLSQQPDVMAAVQTERQIAYRYGYLRSNPQVIVTPGPYIGIAPVNPGFVVVPVYNPAVVFVAPRPGFFVGGAINFGFGVGIGVAFRPWGWGVTNIGWATRTVVVNNAPWGLTWANRAVYVHPYVGVPRPVVRPGPAAGFAARPNVGPGAVRPAAPVAPPVAARPVAPPAAARPGVAPQATRPAPQQEQRRAPAKKEDKKEEERR